MTWIDEWSLSPHLTRVAQMPVERYASEYNMKHVRRGMAIIFNHEHFDIQSLKSRTGTNVDCENLKNTLERLSFDVTVHRDKRYNEIMDIVTTCKCAFSCHFLFVCNVHIFHAETSYWVCRRATHHSNEKEQSISRNMIIIRMELVMAFILRIKLCRNTIHG